MKSVRVTVQLSFASIFEEVSLFLLHGISRTAKTGILGQSGTGTVHNLNGWSYRTGIGTPRIYSISKNCRKTQTKERLRNFLALYLQ
jgi:hypothetical protein